MYIKEIKNLSQRDVLIAGGKGSSLGEMSKIGIRIPSGFVVLTSAFDAFLQATDLNVEVEAIFKKNHYEDISSVEKALVEIVNLIKNTEFPENIANEIRNEFRRMKAPLVAVRSSATTEDSRTASWAGELESFLNVDKDNLLDSVKKCWLSLFTPRVIFYRFQKGFHNQKVSVGVIVQEMVQSEISGIVFTVHPITNDENQMVIEAGYGLGEVIVEGRITPDTYVINKNKPSIINKNISMQRILIAKSVKGGNIEKSVLRMKQGKQKLSNGRIINLARICINIEKHYKRPQDIEWAFEKEKLYILQSRPITTLTPYN